MSERKRFTYEHFDWLQWHIFDNGEFLVEISGVEDDAKSHCDFLNSLNDKIDKFEFILQEAVKTEKTDMGRNVLKNLAYMLGVEI